MKAGIPVILKSGSRILNPNEQWQDGIRRRRGIDGPVEVLRLKIRFQSNQKELRKMVYFVDIAQAQASNPADKTREMALIQEMPGGCNRINSTLKGALVGATYHMLDPQFHFLNAAACGEFELCPWLLPDEDHTAQIIDSESLGMVLRAASEAGYLVPVQMILAKGADPDSQRKFCAQCAPASHLLSPEARQRGCGHEVGGDRPLLLAARAGHAPVIRELLEAKADPNYANSRGTTALYSASFHNHVDALRLLLDAGAEIPLTKYVDQSGLLESQNQASGLFGSDNLMQSLLGEKLTHISGIEIPFVPMLRPRVPQRQLPFCVSTKLLLSPGVLRQTTKQMDNARRLVCR